MNYIVIDQGTSSTKAFLFNSKGEIIHRSKIKYTLDNSNINDGILFFPKRVDGSKIKKWRKAIKDYL
tara:strand:- start:280 stop:480 length:201 start_codon:yes stop_codon:yes gene_type:complete